MKLIYLEDCKTCKRLSTWWKNKNFNTKEILPKCKKHKFPELVFSASELNESFDKIIKTLERK